MKSELSLSARGGERRRGLAGNQEKEDSILGMRTADVKAETLGIRDGQGWKDREAATGFKGV